MKRMNRIYKSVCLSGCLALMTGIASCEDFLTIYPSGQITEEQFWEDKNDLESVVAGCYYQMTTGDMVNRYVLWGEARSDNFDLTMSSWTDAADMINANLLATNDIYKWDSFYKCINYCNKVLERGPQIMERDPSFTEGDWNPIKAEVTAIRALNYFYLVRTFRDVPLVLESVDTDEDAMAQKVGQTSSQEILTHLIQDLEEVKDLGMLKYGNSVYDKGRFTRNSIYTLLADIYLWRAAKNAPADSVAKYPDETGQYASQSEYDYHKAIECADYVINKMIEEDRQNGSFRPGFGGGSQDENIYPLIRERMGSGNSSQSTVYNDVFRSKNSSESIFELQFDGSRTKMSTLYNYSDVSGMYANTTNSGVGRFEAATMFQAADDSQDPTGHVYAKTDVRRFYGVEYTADDQREFPIAKYTVSYVQLTRDETNADQFASATYIRVATGSFDFNWIFYRLSDVMLIKAEAISQLYPTDTEKLAEGFNLVNAIYERSNPNLAIEDELLPTAYATGENLYDFVMRERQREFFAEGKRWFDLVRMAQKDNSTTNMLNLLVRKYSANQSAIRAKLASLDALYGPVHEDEIKINSNLKQNPAWKKDESIERN